MVSIKVTTTLYAEAKCTCIVKRSDLTQACGPPVVVQLRPALLSKTKHFSRNLGALHAGFSNNELLFSLIQTVWNNKNNDRVDQALILKFNYF